MNLVKPDRAHWLSGSATDRLFIVTIVIKGIDGLLGVVSGLIFLFLAPHTLDSFVHAVTANELARDPDDILVGLIRHGAEVFAASDRHFAGLYLIVHGVLKAFVALLLLSGRHWAYPVGAAFVALFMAYTIHRLTLHFSWLLVVFFLFDAVTLFLILREWGMHKEARKEAKPA